MRFTPPVWRVLITNLGPPFAGSCLMLYIAELKDARLVSLQAAALILSSASAASFLGPILTAQIARRISPQRLAWVAFLLLMAGLGVLTGRTVPALAAGLFLMVLCYMVIMVLGSAELAARMPDETHSMIAVQLAATALGGMAAGPFAAAMLRLHPISQPTPAILWIIVPSMVVCLASLLPAVFAGDFQARSEKKSARFPWRLGLVWGLVLMAGLHGLCDVAGWNWMALWLLERPGAGTDLVAALISLTWLASLTGRGLTILLARRTSSALALRIAATGATGGMIMALYSHTAWAFIGAFCFYLLWAAGHLPGLIAIVSDRTPEWRAEMTGMLIAVINGAGTVGTSLIGRLGAIHEDATAGMPVAVVAVALFASLVWFGPWATGGGVEPAAPGNLRTS